MITVLDAMGVFPAGIDSRVVTVKDRIDADVNQADQAITTTS